MKRLPGTKISIISRHLNTPVPHEALHVWPKWSLAILLHLVHTSPDPSYLIFCEPGSAIDFKGHCMRERAGRGKTRVCVPHYVCRGSEDNLGCHSCLLPCFETEYPLLSQSAYARISGWACSCLCLHLPTDFTQVCTTASSFLWVPRPKLRFPGLHDKCLVLSHHLLSSWKRFLWKDKI